MKLEKTKIKYHENEYDGVYVTLEENEATKNTEAGQKILFADITLWLDIVSMDTLSSDDSDDPQDEEGEEVDSKVYYYDLAVSFYCNDNLTREQFENFVLDSID